jgi:hypothetical protein
MIKLPLNTKWSQLNNSDRLGSLAYTKNINLDEEGYIKLSPRSVNIFDDDESITNYSDTDFNFPVAFGRKDAGVFKIATTEDPFDLTMTDTTKSIAEDASANNPVLSFNSHGLWWQNKWLESGDTFVSELDTSTGAWTANVITGLTSTVRHYMVVNKSRRQLCVSNGNVVKQYDTSYTGTQDLTLPTDYEVIGMAFNNEKVGIVTRLGSDSQGQNSEAFFFTWDGATGNPSTPISIGAYAGITIKAYKSSFVIITNQGQILYFNGGGFEELAHFPFYTTDKRFDDLLGITAYGDIVQVDGDVIYINIAFDLSSSGRKGEEPLVNCPSGVWCYDPLVGLYHRYSGSLSRQYLHTIPSVSISTANNEFTTSLNIPATGNPMYMSEGCTDITVGNVYYVIKTSATTFKIANTRDEALIGIAVDITDTTLSYFYILELKDYGISYFTASGALAIWGTSRFSYKDILFGNRYLDSGLLSVLTLNTTVPILENRGYFVTPRLFLNDITDNIPSITIKHRPLGVQDKIIVKYKRTDYYGLPTVSPNSAVSDNIVWTSPTEGYTKTDLSEALAAFNLGEELELEIVQGAGAGQMAKITSLAYGSGNYSFTLEEEIVGASSGLKSYFAIDTWKVSAVVDVNTQKEGVFDVPVATTSRAPQFKIELRGYETCIEDILINNISHKQ